MKKNFILKLIIFELSYLLISSLIITLLYYYNIMNSQILNTSLLVIFGLDTFLLSILISFHAKKKGLIIGLTIGVFIVLIVFIIRLLLDMTLDLKFYLKSAIALLLSLSGGIIGVNLRK